MRLISLVIVVPDSNPYDSWDLASGAALAAGGKLVEYDQARGSELWDFGGEAVSSATLASAQAALPVPDGTIRAIDYRTGEWDESKRGNFVCEVYAPDGRIIIAEYAGTWELTYYDGTAAGPRTDAPQIIAAARALHDRVWVVARPTADSCPACDFGSCPVEDHQA